MRHQAEFFVMPIATGKGRWLQFRLRTLLVVCLVVSIGVWTYQWMRWPVRTLREYSALVEQKQYKEAAARLEFEHG